MSLRLFIWVLGSVSTFAFYQFVEPCSSTSLLAFASVELALIILTLLIVSILIIKTANAYGPEALFPLSESDESKYFRKWGSLYATLKPAQYWVFIPDYIFILVKSAIVGVGQVKAPLVVTLRERLMFFLT
jgi:glucan phosphoethanolaminetransferase (alkaline phosphatase superfamily)